MERFGPPTWKALVEAVAHPGGGNHKGLAMEIAKRHQGNLCRQLAAIANARKWMYVAAFGADYN